MCWWNQKKVYFCRRIQQAEVAQLVEHNLAKVGVASSSLVFRSKKETFQETSLFLSLMFLIIICSRGIR